MKHGNDTLLTKGPFNTIEAHQIPKNCRRLNLVYTEKSIRDRCGRVRGNSPIQPTEMVHLVMKRPILCEWKDRLHYDGANQGQSMVGINAAK